MEFLNGQITNELADLRPGEGCYAAFLTHKGKMLGDLRVLAVSEDELRAPAELLLDTERVALQGLFDMIRRFKVGYEVQLSKRTVESRLFSIVGPEAAGRHRSRRPRRSDSCQRRAQPLPGPHRGAPREAHSHRRAGGR